MDFDAGSVGAVCTTANFLPELVCSIYDKFAAGDVAGSLEAQFKLNPIRLAMDSSSFPVATKDYANLLGLEVGRLLQCGYRVLDLLHGHVALEALPRSPDGSAARGAGEIGVSGRLTDLSPARLLPLPALFSHAV